MTGQKKIKPGRRNCPLIRMSGLLCSRSSRAREGSREPERPHPRAALGPLALEGSRAANPNERHHPEVGPPALLPDFRTIRRLHTVTQRSVQQPSASKARVRDAVDASWSADTPRSSGNRPPMPMCGRSRRGRLSVDRRALVDGCRGIADARLRDPVNRYGSVASMAPPDPPSG